MCREARDGACMEHAEEARAERAGTGERIDKQGEPEMRREVKAAQVTCTVGAESGQCKAGKCISIGEDNVCTDCAKAGEVPINGKCVAYINDLVTTPSGCTKSSGDLDAQSHHVRKVHSNRLLPPQGRVLCTIILSWKHHLQNCRQYCRTM